MAWIYLAEEGKEHEPYHRGSLRMPTVKSTCTPSESFWLRCLEERYRLHLSAMIYARSLPKCCHSDQTLWLLGSPARAFHLLDAAKAWNTAQAVFSSSCYGSSMIYDRLSSSWKIAQSSLFEELSKSPDALPKWGMMVDGVCYRLKKPLEIVTSEKDGGACLPTPTASSYGSNKGGGLVV